MENSNVVELIDRSRADGAQLYSVADTVHKLAVFLIGLVAILGLVLSFGALINIGFLAGLATVVLVGLICFLLYAANILAVNGLKVLVHILFSNLVLIQNGEGKVAVKGGDAEVSNNNKSVVVTRELNEEEMKIKGECLKILNEAGYEIAGEEFTKEGYIWIVKSKYGNSMTFAGLEALKNFCNAYKK